MPMRLYVLQRATAVLMVPLVLGHLAIIFIATGQELSADAVLARTQGSIGWAVFYAVFVLTVAVHGAIGLRAILSEWAGLRGAALEVLMWMAGLVLVLAGLRAVLAVTFPGALG